MIRQKIRLLGGLFALLVAYPAYGSDLRLITEDLPPMSFMERGQPAGMGVELAHEIMKRLKIQVPVTVEPWAHGYQTALLEANVGLFATARTAEREQLFQWVGPIFRISDSFYAKRGAGVHLGSLNEAMNAPLIPVLKASYSQQLLEKLGFKNLHQVPSPEHAVRMVLAGRAHFVLISSFIVPNMLSKIGAKPTALEPVFTVASTYTYIAFSKGTPAAVVQQWQNTLDQMKKDGSFAAIYTKWFPGETPPGLEPQTALQFENERY